MAKDTGVFLPDEQEQEVPKKPAQSMRSDGQGNKHTESTAPDDAEIRKLNEEELKAAIVSEWRKLERIGKKQMGPLLYWLREKLRAQGARNDIRDQDKGFGSWVEKTIEISRRTADRWADDYAYAKGLKVRKTSGQDDQKLFSTEEDDFYAQELRKHGRQIQMNYWVSRSVFQQYESAVKILKRHFKTNSNQEAVVKGAVYASQVLGRGATRSRLAQKAEGIVAQGKISRVSRKDPRSQRQSQRAGVLRHATGSNSDHGRTDRHRGAESPRTMRAAAGR